MVNALLLRIHQSGHLAELSPAALALVHEGIAAYHTWRHRIPAMEPFWPLGWPAFTAPVVCLGLKDDEGVLLALWRQDRSGTNDEPVHLMLNLDQPVGWEVAYPGFAQQPGAIQTDAGSELVVDLPPGYAARILRGTFTTLGRLA
jgi:alpha-galactosidase